MTRQQEYFNTAWPDCLAASKACGVRPEIIFAQSALETGYGLHHPQNNYFGIKGLGSSLSTTEYINGVATRVSAHFSGFPSMASSFMGYASFIRNNRRYKTFDSGGSLSAQLVALGTSGYATDPNYTMKVGSIVDLVPEYLAEYNLDLEAEGKARSFKLPLTTGDKTMTPIEIPPNTPILSELGKEWDQATQPVSNLISELTAHKTGLQVAINVATSLLPFAPIPAAASTAVTDVLNGLSGLANKPIPATATTPEQPAPAEPAVVEQPIPAGIQDALNDAGQFLSTIGADFAAGNLTVANVEKAAEAEVPVAISQAETLFNPALGIEKNPNAN